MKPLKSVNDAIQFLHYVFFKAIKGEGIKEKKGNEPKWYNVTGSDGTHVHLSVF